MGYNSKKLPKAVQNYSVTELELFGLVVNIYAFKQLLTNIYFKVFCDHSAIVQILNGKKKLPTRRIQRLIEHLLPFNFTIQYLPGNKMHIADILSRLAGKDLEPSDQLIPISFNVHTRSTRPLKQYYANRQKTSIPYKAPQIWMDYITLILSQLEHRARYIAIMDDLPVHRTKAEHWLLIEQLFQSMVKNGLILSPKKCQFFKTNLVYMGNEFVISQKNIMVTPLRSRTEAIVKIPTPHTPRQCKSFCGVVSYLALFCLDLQTLLKPIITLTRKEIPFRWGKEQEEAFQEVKHRISTPPVLHLPRAIGRLVLFSDTSKVGTGSSLWQYQDGKPHLFGYASKTLPEVCSHYSVTELEMTGVLVNMRQWNNILKHREFDAAVDHVAVTQILKAKKEPASNRIMRLLDCLSAYCFNLYYLKGKDMILADF